MSLVTLAFGSKNRNPTATINGISTPSDRIRQRIEKTENATGTVEIVKACSFYGDSDEAYLVGNVLEGFVGEGMVVTYKDKEIELVEIESKYGNNAKQGMTIGISLKGVTEADFELGSTLTFKKIKN